MRKVHVFLVVFIGLLVLMVPSANAQEADAMLEDSLTGNLAFLEDTRWYSFEMSEPGDAELIIHGLQDHWNGWDTHWIVVVYAPDQQTVLAEGTARGYNGNGDSPPARFSLLALESGTYFVQISAASADSFITDSFLLELNKTYSPTLPLLESGEEDIYVMGTEPFTDSLASKDQIRWYSFEMTEPGDAVFVITGLQDHWDGYSYHWSCAICEEDRETIITGDSIRGYSETDGPNILSATGLDVGKYYVRMSSAWSANPLMATFTTDPYKIHLLRYYPSASVISEASNQVRTFQNAGDVLWAFDGTAFLKLYDGECYGALMESSN